MFVSTSLEPEDETGENEPMMENSSVELPAESHESAQVGKQ